MGLTQVTEQEARTEVTLWLITAGCSFTARRHLRQGITLYGSPDSFSSLSSMGFPDANSQNSRSQFIARLRTQNTGLRIQACFSVCGTVEEVEPLEGEASASGLEFDLPTPPPLFLCLPLTPG